MMSASELIKSRLSANAALHSASRYRYARDIAAPALALAFHADRVWLFGSVARNEATEDSDIDLLVECKEGCLPIKERLFLANEVIASISAPFDFDVAALTSREFNAKIESPFIQSIISDRELIYGQH